MRSSDLENQEFRDEERVLQEATLLVGGNRIHYRLFSLAAQYLLRMEGEGESCVLDMGDTLSTAAYVFESFVRGRVTPYTAEEVWEDLYMQGIFEEKTALCTKIP